MDANTKAALTNLNTWKRGLFMILFSIISGFAKMIVTAVAIFQFITVLVKGQPNAALIPFGQNLSTFLYQITLFLTFKSEDMPFPFGTFPDGAPEIVPNETEEENVVVTEAPTTTSDDIVASVDSVDSVDEDAEEEAVIEKDTKDDAKKE